MEENITIRISAIDEATKSINQVADSVSKLQTSFKGIKTPDISGLGKGFSEIEVSVKKLSSSMVDLTGFYQNWAKGIDRGIAPIKENYSGFTNLGTAMRTAGISTKDFQKWQKQSFFTMDNGQGLTNALTGETLDYGRAVQQATIQNRRFKMEWLSIMFAGMALSRAFGSIVKAQEDLWGITQINSALWTVVMADIMEPYSALLTEIAEKIMNLPPETKVVIGLTVLGLKGLGDVLTVIGEVYLAMMGLGLLFPSLAKAVATAGGGIKGFFAVLGAKFGELGVWISGIGAGTLAIIGIIVAVIVGMYLAWKDNILGMRDVVKAFIDGLVMMFKGLITVLGGVLDILVGLFTGDFEKIKQGIVKIFQGLWTILKGGFVALSSAIVGIFIGLLTIVWNLVRALVDAIIWVANQVIKLFGGKGTSFKMPKLPSYDTGGIVPQTGPAILHKGEQVIPKNQVGSSIVFSPATTIHANISNSYDVRKLADELNSYWAQDFQRMMRSRGSI